MPKSFWITAGVLVIALLAFLIRWIDIHRSLWLDELHTSWTVSGSLSDVLSRAQQGNQSPFYFYCVWIVNKIFGHSEWSLRLISVLSGSGLVILASGIIYRLSQSAVAAIVAALLFMLDPYLVEYSQEARPYALLQFFGLLQIYFFGHRFLHTQVNDTPVDYTQYREQEGQPGNNSVSNSEEAGLANNTQFRNSVFSKIGIYRLGLILSIALCFYTHFTSVLLTGSLVIFLVGWNAFRGNAWTAKRFSLLTDVLLGLLCGLPLVGSILAISARRQNWELFVDDYQMNPSLVFQFWVYVVPGACLLVFWLLTSKERSWRQNANLIPLFFSAYLLTILLAWIALKADWAALYHQRYFMIGWSSLILAVTTSIGICLRSHSRAHQIAGILAGVLTLVLSITLNAGLKHVLKHGEMPFASTWNQAIEELNQHSQGKGTLFLFSNLIEDQSLGSKKEIFQSGIERNSKEIRRDRDDLIDYCLFPVHGLYESQQEVQLPRPTLFRPRFGDQDRDRMIEGKLVYLLIRGDQAIVSDILNEFARFGLDHQLWIENRASEFYEFRGAKGQYISWFAFEIRDESNNDPK